MLGSAAAPCRPCRQRCHQIPAARCPQLVKRFLLLLLLSTSTRRSESQECLLAYRSTFPSRIAVVERSRKVRYEQHIRTTRCSVRARRLAAVRRGGVPMAHIFLISFADKQELLQCVVEILAAELPYIDFPYCGRLQIQCIHKKRYLLRPVALKRHDEEV